MCVDIMPEDGVKNGVGARWVRERADVIAWGRLGDGGSGSCWGVDGEGGGGREIVSR